MRSAIPLLLAAVLTCAAAAAQPTPKEPLMHLYLGTYTGQKQPPQSRGIYHLTLDPQTGKLSEPELAAETTNPSFLAIHPTQSVLYAIGEVGEFKGEKVGMASAFQIDPATAKLTPLGEPQSTGGPGPAYVSVTPDGRVVLVANYGGGSVTGLPVNADGSLGTPTKTIQHAGSGPNKKRQNEPHAHSINPAPGGMTERWTSAGIVAWAVACDLGTDEIPVYAVQANGKLTHIDRETTKADAGGGPRHTAFSPDGKHAYVCNEMGNTVTAFAWDAAKASLIKIESTPTLPPGYTGLENTTAEVAVHPSGKFVYVSNRGHDSIAVFARDAETGQLAPAGHTPTGGSQPRHFALSADGRFLVAANQKTHNVVVFTVDATTGALTPNGSEVRLAAPVCVRFVRDGLIK
jgi:6-phosphogluconolactonase